jgi:thiamine biosynthesis lipoprotein
VKTLKKSLPTLIITAAATSLMLTAAASSCQSPSATAEWHKASGSVWHTLYNVTYLAPTNLDDSIVEAMHRVEMSLSPFQPQSVISRINRNETDTADAQIFTVMTCAQQVNRLSDGLFDPTVAPLVNHWGYGYAEPDTAAIASLLERVGIDRCSISATDYRVGKKHPLTEFNFSAVTKGYGCDAVGEMLLRNGCSDFLVEIGGEITAHGSSPRSTPWHVMVDAPVESNTKVIHDSLTTMDLTNCGVATSGNYRNYRLTAQGKTSHTINPRTGMPMTMEQRSDTVTLSATIVAQNAMLADALATASMLMSPSRAIGMVKQAGGYRVILAVQTPGDSLKVIDAWVTASK